MNNVYNPDVLLCLANLSNDEVFTPPELANDMLDLLPASIWRNKDATFLDPVSKSGVFLREIVKRLDRGLESQIPNKQRRLDHILTNQVFGIAITELTSLVSRRSVYCSKYANGKYSITEAFKDEQGNIKYERLEHTWKKDRCTNCGASQQIYERDPTLENYAYYFIHSEEPENIFNMKFDVIIGNPPYQLSDGSGASSDAALPVYNRFIEQAKHLKPAYLIMITPSKWMVGGRGLQKFREEMLSDKRIRYIFDFENAADCFPGLHIDGGVNFFLWEREYNGKMEYSFKSKNGEIITSKKYLKNDIFDYVIRDNRILSIIDKISSDKKFSSIVSNTKPFGIRKYLFNEPNRYPEADLQLKPYENYIKIYGVKGIKGGAKRIVGYVNKNVITNNTESISKFKLFFTTSYSTNAVQPPETIVANENEVCTETFLMIGPFDNQQNQQNCLSYMKTDFFKFLLYFGKGTMQVTKSVFGLIPLQEFNELWNDDKLYKKYRITEDEIRFINSIVRPNEVSLEHLIDG